MSKTMSTREREQLIRAWRRPWTPVAYETVDGQAVAPPVVYGLIQTPQDERVFVNHANPRMRWERA